MKLFDDNGNFNPTCSCVATARCCHIMAGMISIGMKPYFNYQVTNRSKAKPRSITQTRLNALPRASRKTGAKNKFPRRQRGTKSTKKKKKDLSDDDLPDWQAEGLREELDLSQEMYGRKSPNSAERKADNVRDVLQYLHIEFKIVVSHIHFLTKRYHCNPQVIPAAERDGQRSASSSPNLQLPNMVRKIINHF